jgi:hypothetical protein
LLDFVAHKSNVTQLVTPAQVQLGADRPEATLLKAQSPSFPWNQKGSDVGEQKEAPAERCDARPARMPDSAGRQQLKVCLRGGALCGLAAITG